jgi:hypothetical protein
VRSCSHCHTSAFRVPITAHLIRSAIYTATFANDTRIVAKATELDERLVVDFKGSIPDGDFTIQFLLQALPKVYGESFASCERFA